MSDFLSFLSDVGVYPLLVLLWVKFDACQKSNEAVLHYLADRCPHCDALKVLFSRK